VCLGLVEKLVGMHAGGAAERTFRWSRRAMQRLSAPERRRDASRFDERRTVAAAGRSGLVRFAARDDRREGLRAGGRQRISEARASLLRNGSTLLNMMIWNAAIYCALVVQDIVIVGSAEPCKSRDENAIASWALKLSVRTEAIPLLYGSWDRHIRAAACDGVAGRSAPS
jgi:hypothetical protein